MDHRPLHQGRGVDETEDAVGQGERAEHRLLVGHGRMDGEIADALARQRQLLGIGGGDDGVGGGGHQRRHLMVVEDDVAVGLVRDQIDGGAEPFAGRIEHLPQLVERLGRIDLAGGVVGRVDEHHFGFGVERRLNGRQIDVELRIRGHHLGDAAVIVDVEFVFDKEGGENDHLVAGVEQGLEDDIETTGRAAGHEDVAGTQGNALLGAKPLGQCLADKRVAGVGHVAVHAGLLVGGQIAKHGIEFGRRRHIRVADAEIEHLVGAELGLQPCALLEHLANPGGLFRKRLHFLGYTTHCTSSLC